jgi:transcription elongation factor Elf1
MMRAMTMQPSRDILLVYPTYPTCPSCGRALNLARTIPAGNGLAELQTLNCRECSLWITESANQYSEWSKPESS